MESEKKSPIKKFLVIIFIVGVVLISLLYLDYDRSLKIQNSYNSEKVTFQIKEGQNVNVILSNLIDAGLLRKRYLYNTKIYLKLNKLGTKLQAGTYSIPKDLSMKELITTLQNGKEQDIWVTIPEGLRKDEIATILEKEFSKFNKVNFYKDEFLMLTTDQAYINTLDLPITVSNLEGFLFPDKYAFSQDSNTESVINTLVSNFKNKVSGKYTYEDIIMASIVEREGYGADDRPVVAGILLKRIKEGWLLQADATLLYPKQDWKYVITKQDIDEDNPYNSYKRIGLPPTPICNPGLQAVEASRNPKESSYYYYIHGKDGTIKYATTLEEHNANIIKYLR